MFENQPKGPIFSSSSCYTFVSSLPMVFRLPSHLDSFVPPPSFQQPHVHTWRGTLTVSGMRASDKASHQELRVSAVESDGDKIELWPSELFVYLTHDRPILRDVQAWVKHHSPPLSTFLPDRLRDVNHHTVNQTTFRSLSRILYENRMVAVAPWNREDIQQGGIVFMPAENSSAILLGILFLNTPIPDFILGTSFSSAQHAISSSVSGGYPAYPSGPAAVHAGSSSAHASLPTISATFRHPSHSPTGAGGVANPADEDDLATLSPISERSRFHAPYR